MKIAQVLNAGSWGTISPETLERGLGGRETAMVSLAKVWSDAGHDVSCFVPADKGTRIATKGYHEYLPIGMAGPMLKNMPWDAVVAWECPSIFNDPQVKENARVKVCEMQVAHFPDGELQAAQDHVDFVAALSNWHAEFLKYSGFDGEFEIFPNGIDISRFPKEEVLDKIERYNPNITDPYFVYSSSPDRGLWNILLAWGKILQIWPDAKISITYGLKDYVNNLKWAHTRNAQMCIELEELVKQRGVEDLGKVGQTQLASMLMKADAWLYPLDPVWPTETGCITAIENAAAGNPLIITAADCLPSEFGSFSSVIDLPFDADAYVKDIYDVLNDVVAYQMMAGLGRNFAETRNWKNIGGQWLNTFETLNS